MSDARTESVKRPRKQSVKLERQSAVFQKPAWSDAPKRRGIHFEVWRPKKATDQEARPDTDSYFHALNICIDTHSYYLIGTKSDVCDFTVHHPTCSRVHLAVIHHAKKDAVYVVDLHSTHGTFINGVRIPPSTPVELKTGDTLQTAYSSRRYVLRLHAPVRKEVKMEVAAFLDELRNDESTARSERLDTTRADPKNDGLESDAQSPENEERVGYHILIKHCSVQKPVFRKIKITRSKEEALALIGEVKQQLKAGEADFRSAAAQHSECLSGHKSGGRMPPMARGKDCGELNALRDAIWNLPQGEVSSPVETKLGFHILTWLKD
ncbi:peptidyl-prolyl cis-trans isomerase parvulin-type [Perkinsela sp. CCAP 1560/4]|nr:peptidyl-prolyl cis-trans isomerase parvulin-type [Perkinsela sp. CCAP 1560/4]|eukprot:KNH08539.1 peptidyl-prolyl cis-trans isomerase parvulin-type [Perkinsela sp. CCAP 1560/4]